MPIVQGNAETNILTKTWKHFHEFVCRFGAICVQVLTKFLRTAVCPQKTNLKQSMYAWYMNQQKKIKIPFVDVGCSSFHQDTISLDVSVAREGILGRPSFLRSDDPGGGWVCDFVFAQPFSHIAYSIYTYTYVYGIYTYGFHHPKKKPPARAPTTLLDFTEKHQHQHSQQEKSKTTCTHHHAYSFWPFQNHT